MRAKVKLEWMIEKLDDHLAWCKKAQKSITESDKHSIERLKAVQKSEQLCIDMICFIEWLPEDTKEVTISEKEYDSIFIV